MIRKALSHALLLAVTSVILSACSHHNYILQEARDDYYNHHYAEAFRKTNYIAKTGDPRAEYALGVMYFYGNGAPKDQDFARYWIKRAAYKHYPPAEHALYLLERSPVPQTMPSENYGPGYPPAKIIKREHYGCAKLNGPPPKRPVPPTKVPKSMMLMEMVKAKPNTAKPQPVLAKNKVKVMPNKVPPKLKLTPKVTVAPKVTVPPKIAVTNSVPPKKQPTKNTRTVIGKNEKPMTDVKIINFSANKNFHKDDYYWATHQNPQNYTLQLTVSDRDKQIKRLLSQQFYGSKVVPYQFKAGKETRYSAVIGSFKNMKEAREFKSKLPKAVARHAEIYPWKSLHRYMKPYS